MHRIYKAKYIIIAIIFYSVTVKSQITLEECHIAAVKNYPLIKQYELIASSLDYSLSNVAKNYLPQLTLTAQFSIQNKVSEFPEVLSQPLSAQSYDYLGIAKEQYRIGLNIEQIVWDGGNIAAQKENIRQEAISQKAKLDMDIYALKERINNLYFSILLLQQKIEINQEIQLLLDNTYSQIKHLKSSGMVMQSDIDNIKAEYLKSVQQGKKLFSAINSYKNVLAVFINKDIEDLSDLTIPQSENIENYSINRPELTYSDIQIKQFDIKQRINNASLMPKFSFFATGYYGYPGYNIFKDMLSHNISFNAMVGLRFVWNISELYTNKNKKTQIILAKQNLEIAKETFVFNNNLKVIQQKEKISLYKNIIKDDEEIITLRKQIRKASESEFSNGIINLNTLLQDINKEKQAKIEQSIHKIEYLKYIYELKNTLNR